MEIWSFLGLAGYYWKFVEGFSKIAIPLTLLMKKNMKFVSGEIQEKYFHELKDKLMSAPVLAMSSGTKGFVIYNDALKLG